MAACPPFVALCCQHVAGGGTCEARATKAWLWPGYSMELFTCADHAERAQALARVMGFEVRVEEAQEVWRRAWEAGQAADAVRRLCGTLEED